MKYPPATLRRSGKKMMTTKIEVDIGIGDLVNAATNVRDRGLEITKIAVWIEAKAVLLDKGIFSEYDDADWGLEDKVYELFPELL